MKIGKPARLLVLLTLGLLLVILPGNLFGMTLGLRTASAISVTTTIRVGTNPNFMAFDSIDNTMFVVNTGSGSVSAINAETNAIITTIKVTKPNDIVYNSANDEVYVVSENTHVVAISGSTDKVVSKIFVPVDDFYQDLAYDPANGNVYVASTNSGVVSVINSSTNTVISKIKTGSEPQHLLFDPANDNIYVSVGTHSKSPYVDVISGSTNTVIATVTTTDAAGSDPAAFLAYNPANQEVYQSDDIGNVFIISSSSNTLVATLSLFSPASCCTLLTMTYNPSNLELYAAATGIAAWTISSSNSVVSTISLSGANGYLAYDSVNNNVYAAGGTTYVLSGSSVVAQFTVAAAGFDLFNPAGNNVYVSQTQSPGKVEVISS